MTTPASTQPATPPTNVASGPGAPALLVRGAVKRYGDVEVLRGIDLRVERGEVVALIGPSGSGKSTLLRAVNALERLDLGYVQVAGEHIGVVPRGGRLHQLPARRLRRQRARIGFVFQGFHLFGNLTVLDNVAEGPVAHGAPRASARRRALELLHQVGIADKASAYPRQLSGGQQQRAAIARALALEPEVVLLDEPTSALDPELVGEVLAVIRDLAQRGRTLVVVTHEIAFAREVADRVVFLDGGVVVEEGSAAQVIDHPREPRTREFLGKVL